MRKYNEKEYEDFIDNQLLNNGYEPRHYTDYDRSLCLDTELLFRFLEDTQSKEIEQLKIIYSNDYKTQIAKRLFKQIQSKTIVEVLRDGIKDNGIKLSLAFDKPNSNLNEDDNIHYTKNIFSVMRQVHFSTKNEKSLDMVLFLNGLPIITLELKNELTGQNVNVAIKQYKQDRDPKEELFKFGRCLVHFAVDTSLVSMTTKLAGQKTFFLPFNKGLNAGNTDKDLKKGAGNPSCETLKTAYLWEDIFQKDRLIDIIKNYTQYIEEKNKDTKEISKKIIFPRFHQLDVVTKLLDDTKEKGVGEKYLIQHSAGSGKSNSISWLAHKLVSHMDSTNTKPIFDTVIVVTDRKILDKQIQDNIKDFAKVKKVVEAITDGSKQLKQSLKDGKKIIISTIQKFPYIVDDIGDLSDKNFAIIIDEAHSSTSGSTMQGMGGSIGNEMESEEEYTIEDEIVEIIKAKKLQKNASYFAFTATPKNKTLEIFGRKIEDGGYVPFHLYSMKQAIEENFIIDVLKNYTTYDSYYKLLKAIDDDPKYDTKRASRKLKHHVEIQKVTIDKKIQIIGDHFFDNVIKKIKGQAKAMIVTQSRQEAIKYFNSLNRYLKDNNHPYKAIVAFSGTIKVDDAEYTESKLNGFSDSKTKEEFDKQDYKFLVVANKYQTGFDQPKLHTMYVFKKLGGVNCVQTLSRLNRVMPNKKETFVLDFYNEHDDIEESFKEYYEMTSLKEKTDPNKLFDLVEELDKFNIYDDELLDEFVEAILTNKKENVIHPFLDSGVDEFNLLDDDKKIEFKGMVQSFLRLYSFLIQIIPHENIEIEKKYIFLSKLFSKLEIEKDEDLSKGILDNIDYDSYRIQLNDIKNISLGGDCVMEPMAPYGNSGKSEVEIDVLSNIIQSFNDKFGSIDFGDEDKIKRVVQNISDDIRTNSEFVKATSNTDRMNKKVVFDDVATETMQDYFMGDSFKIYQQFTNNDEFKKVFLTQLFEKVNFDMMTTN